MLKPVRTVAPATLPVTLDEAKRQLKLEPGDLSRDEEIDRFIAAAVDLLDARAGVLGVALCPQTWRASFESWACEMRLPIGPAIAVSSVGYIDPAGGSQVFASTDYALYEDALSPFVALLPGKFWPSLQYRRDAVSIVFTAGHPEVSGITTVPESIRHAILLLVTDWDSNRETQAVGTISSSLANSFDALVTARRRAGF